MKNQPDSAKRAGIFLPPGQGRSYPMGRISAIFKTDVLNFSIPGDFELSMPAIAKWFAENPPKDA